MDVHAHTDVGTAGEAGATILEQRLASALRYRRPHQDADLIELLPFAVEGRQGTDLGTTGRDAKSRGNLRLLPQLMQRLPFRIAVIHDEEFGPCLHFRRAHGSAAARPRRILRILFFG